MKRSDLRRLASAALLAAAVATPAPTGAVAQPSDAAYALVNRLSAAMKRCWFMGGDPMFGDYVAGPEPNASGGPRILVVPRSTPDGRPVLVVEILGAGAKPKVNVYGPLAVGAAGERIGRDLRRWIDGGDACS